MNSKKWNWEQQDWPYFRFDSSKLAGPEAVFLHESGVLSGTIRHIGPEDKKNLTVDLISIEALKTSEIEGELLNRESLQSSIRRHFGLAVDQRKIPPAEQGIAEMMLDLYQSFQEVLSDQSLFRWHSMLMNGRRDLTDVGRYRTGKEPMQVVSGPLHEPRVHFQAPPSTQMSGEMKSFISWFNRTAPGGPEPVPALTRAGLVHHYFVCIHPFEDGNGRLARALSEKALSQVLGQPTLIALSQILQSQRKKYYDLLEKSNKHNEITEWLLFYAETVLDAQRFTIRAFEFLIAKTKYFDHFRGLLNMRQEKALLRMFREGSGGFKGGMSAEKYISITGTSRATAGRDLLDLVEKRALTKCGVLKGTRYHLNLPV